MYKKIFLAFLVMVLFFTTVGFTSKNAQAEADPNVIPENGGLSPIIVEEIDYENLPEGEIPSYAILPDVGTPERAVAGQCDYKMTGFVHHSTIKYSEKVEKLVIAAGAITVSTLVPWSRVKIPVQLANTANLIFGSNVYSTQVYYRMFAQTGKNILPVAAEKTITRFYSNSARTKLLGTKTHYKYSDWYCK